jgi:hypothetical protein
MAVATPLMGAMLAAGCNRTQFGAPGYDDIVCPGGTTLWRCTLLVLDKCACQSELYGPQDVPGGGCGDNAASASNDAANRLREKLISEGLSINGRARTDYNAQIEAYPPRCTDTGATSCGNSKTVTCPLHRQVPKYTPQSVPDSCPADPADDACVSCAKVSCCADYVSCLADTNCSCLVACLAEGNSIATCIAADLCGGVDSIASSAAACLNTACPGQCTNGMGSMGGTCTCSSSSSSSSSGSGCTPGPSAFGETCASDADCASCSCDLQSTTCN